MKKLVVAGISLLAVGLLILGSQANVVGYQVVQASQQTLVKERLNYYQQLPIPILTHILSSNHSLGHWLVFLIGLLRDLFQYLARAFLLLFVVLHPLLLLLVALYELFVSHIVIPLIVLVIDILMRIFPPGPEPVHKILLRDSR